MSLHTVLIERLKAKGKEAGYTIGKNAFSVPDRKNIFVDVCWKKERETKVWEVELKAHYEEKLFKFHLLKENVPNLSFGLVVQRDDSKRQVQRVVDRLFSKSEKQCLEIITVDQLTGKSIEELSKPIHPLFWAHRDSPRMCVALFSPCVFEDGFNRGLRLTGIFLKEQGYAIDETQNYLIWLAGKLGLPEFETKSVIKQIATESFPSCRTIQQPKKGRGPHILKLGDLNVQHICIHCPHSKRQLSRRSAHIC